jgi:hypothetical protein
MRSYHGEEGHDFRSPLSDWSGDKESLFLHLEPSKFRFICSEISLYACCRNVGHFPEPFWRPHCDNDTSQELIAIEGFATSRPEG